MDKLIFILIIAIAFILLYMLERFISSKKEVPNLSNNEEIPIEKDYNSFYKKEYLLTKTELKFYKILKAVTDKLELTLFCQVAMYELVNCKNFKDFNTLRSKSIDFVITEKKCKIKCCIELDDETHNTSKRIKRDKIVEDIFRSAGVKLLRIKVQNYYDMQELEQLIKNNI